MKKATSDTILKTAISEVNSNLGPYDAGYVSVKRFPGGDFEDIETFEQYLECRLNQEVSLEVPELEPYVEMFEGKLFLIKSVEFKDDIERKKNHFTLATAEINMNPNDYFGDSDFNEVMDNIFNIIGGRIIKFNASPKRIKIIIE